MIPALDTPAYRKWYANKAKAEAVAESRRRTPLDATECWVLDARRALSRGLDIVETAVHVCRTIPEVEAACYDATGYRLKRARRIA